MVPAAMRSQMIAILLFTANVANLIAAPQLVGPVSDWLAPTSGGNGPALRIALLCLAPTGFWAACHYWVAARHIRGDVIRLAA